MTNPNEREAFEAWAKNRLNLVTVPDGRYLDPDTSIAWTAWQAALTREQREGDRCDGSRPLAIDRDLLGRLVREEWVRWAREQPNPKPSWLVPYDELPEADKEADRRIGECAARWAIVHDAARASQPQPEAPGAVASKRIRWINIYPPQLCEMGQEEFVHLTKEDAARHANNGAETVQFVEATPPAPVDVQTPNAEQMRLHMGELTTEEVLIAQAAFRLGAVLQKRALLDGQPAGVDAQRNADYFAGWCAAARWADREDLIADEGSAAYARDRQAALGGGGGGE